MSRTTLRTLTLSVFSAFLLHAASSAQGVPARGAAIDQVNMLLGTAAEGQTYPAAGVPFGMTQWAPQTREGETKCVAPYYFADKRIQGFRATHFLTGSCAQDYGSFTLMPLLDDSHLQAADRASSFSHSSEQATPYLYSVDLATSGIHADITAASRSGLLRFRFPATATTGVIDLENNVRLGTGTITIDPVRNEITAENPVFRIYAGSGQTAGFSGYLVVQFDQPFEVGGTWTGADRQPGTRSVTHPGSAVKDGAPSGAYVILHLPPSHTVQIRVGTSFTSLSEARANLHAEIPAWNFEEVSNAARQAWQRRFSVLEVHGEDPRRRIFYTALYHASLLPRTFSDVSGSYPRFAGGTPIQKAAGWTYYDDFSAWDTFRALHPLLTLIDPDRDGDMVHSLIAKGEQGGFLPIFPAWNSYTSEMIGDHTAAIITDAYVKGIRNFDAEEAYRLMRQNALITPPRPEYLLGRGRRALDAYERYGFIPLEDPVPDAFHKGEQVSRTLEYAYDDFVVSVMAKALGHDADASMFLKRSSDYRNVIDPETGFARGRHADGSWDSPFNPAIRYHYITEGIPFQYTFFVPQDIPGLIAATGGRQQFLHKLDTLFADKLYDHGNEPSHHIAYLYNFAGQPGSTQRQVHQIMAAEYRDTPSGLSGNDDAGQMSAWYVLSALGFYAVTPGTPRYEIGTPQFDDVTLHLPKGRSLHILARGAEAGRFYIQSIRLNGKPLGRLYLLHSELTAGGELVFTMGKSPAL